ncbi:MAG: deoxyribonuclease IV [Nitrospiraceae bacterium]|nr:deoxyribonuclease IV [Nitrospiraceae bacterium]
MRRLGVHASIAGGLPKSLERARALGCSTLQIFSHNPRGWALTDIPEEEARRFRRLREKLGLDPVFIHACYLINLASANIGTREKSLLMLDEEMRRADLIGADYVVVHAGQPAGRPADYPSDHESGGDTGDSGYVLLVQSLKKVLGSRKKRFRAGPQAAGLLLENAACPPQFGGAASIKTLALAAGSSGAAGLCLDTCHAFASGYDIRTASGLSELARQTQGVSVRLVHLNDSKGQIGSGLDRHEHLGKGRIGTGGLRRFIRFGPFRGLPLVLETPRKEESDDPMNLEAARALIGR